MTVPQHVVDHCNRHPGCKGCPLIGSCSAPLCPANDSRWQEWLDQQAEEIRALSKREAA